MEKKLKAGIMFCGGCNVYYERGDVYESLRQELGDICDFKPSSYLTDEHFDLVIIINGCPSVCMLDIDFGTETLLINNKNYEDAVNIVKQRLGTLIKS